MKKTFLLIVAAILLSFSAWAQSLKVSEVDASDNNHYDKLATMLGKTVTLNLFDNSATLTFGNEQINFKKISGTRYGKTKETAYKTEYMTLVVNKVVGVVSSIEFNVRAVRKADSSPAQWGKIVAKRF